VDIDASLSTGSTARAQVSLLAGNVNPGEIWTVEVGGITYSAEGGTPLPDNPAETVNTVAEVVEVLAAQINAGGFKGIAEGDTLVIVNSNGAMFAPVFEIYRPVRRRQRSSR
jgi:hypothetical protein